jgi:hypothetical protein
MIICGIKNKARNVLNKKIPESNISEQRENMI